MVVVLLLLRLPGEDAAGAAVGEAGVADLVKCVRAMIGFGAVWVRAVRWMDRIDRLINYWHGGLTHFVPMAKTRRVLGCCLGVHPIRSTRQQTSIDRLAGFLCFLYLCLCGREMNRGK